MNSFSNAVDSQMTTTENGMPAFQSSLNENVNFFYKMGSVREIDPISIFSKAWVENRELSLRSLQYLRDIREGMGERQTFRNLLTFLETTDLDAAKMIAARIPELGRFDDLFCFKFPEMKNFAFGIYENALKEGNQLSAKWAPRKGPIANEFRKYLGLSPRAYRKMLVAQTNVVETKMCANQWDEINYSHVPSVAHARSRNAFSRHSPERYQQYLSDLKANKEGVKINASVVFPHDVIKQALDNLDIWYLSNNDLIKNLSATIKDSIIEQWKALPDFTQNANILPMVDVSGSMMSGAGNISPLSVAVGLGLYLCDKNQGAFNGLVLTFSQHPKLQKLTGDIIQKLAQIIRMDWGFNTDIELALEKILTTAIDGKVPQHQMPQALLILSDMQFDISIKNEKETFLEMMTERYKNAGYKVPSVVFWNLNGAKDNIPVRFTEKGTALISGFSPNILKSVLSGNLGELTPEKIMLNAIMSPRYDLI
jgi:hypothetical protein